MANPVLPEVVQQRASRKMDRELSTWLLAPDVELSIPLHPFTGKQAASDLTRAKKFNEVWMNNPHVLWETRAWHAAGLGIQKVPTRFVASGAEEIARIASRATEWSEIRRKFDLLCHPTTAPDIRGTAARMASRWVHLDDADLTRIRDIVTWFLHNPTSGLLPRAVAVEGVHGKWLENNTALVKALLSAARGFPDGSHGELGLRTIDATVRLRRLDPLLRGSEGLEDISVPLSEALSLFHPGPRPQVILMVENQATFLSFDTTAQGSGAVVLWSKGFAAEALAHLPWLNGAKLLYWGDLDSAGFSILHRLRRILPESYTMQSVLMDPDTVRDYSKYGVRDPGDVSLRLSTLTPEEKVARNLLVVNGTLRIEQERIPWSYALAKLRQAGFPTV